MAPGDLGVNSGSRETLTEREAGDGTQQGPSSRRLCAQEGSPAPWQGQRCQPEAMCTDSLLGAQSPAGGCVPLVTGPRGSSAFREGAGGGRQPFSVNVQFSVTTPDLPIAAGVSPWMTSRRGLGRPRRVE